MEYPAKRIVRMVATVLSSFLVALGVAVIAALVADRSQTCSSGDCEDSLLALAVFMISLAVVPVIVVPILASIARLGLVFVTGSTAALALIGIGTFGLAMGWYVVFYPLGVAVLVITVILANRPAAGAHSPAYRIVIVAGLGLAVVSAAAIPLIVKVDNVRTEQRAITKFVEEPLQPEWTDTWPFSVKSTDRELFYMVLQAPDSKGDRVADTEVTIRPGQQPDAPCRMFTDLVAGGARGCTEIQPQVWRADDSEGKPHFWVRGEGQWAHVTSSDFVEDKTVQNE